jgi:uncharacterized protein YxjI
MEDFLSDHNKLLISQKKEWVEVFIDLETKNNYSIIDVNNNEIGFISEVSSGFFSFIKRTILRSHRPLNIEVRNIAGDVLMTIKRPFFWIWSDLFITDRNGNNVGAVHRKFNLLFKVYELYDQNNQMFSIVKSPFWRLWKFPILDKRGNEIGNISKKWQGLFKESLTDADSFAVDFGKIDNSNSQKVVAFSTAISVDFDYFENNSTSVLGIFD